jgi:serine/threonine protein kinase
MWVILQMIQSCLANDSPHKTTAIDLWSVGCILAELLGGKPIYKGREYVITFFSDIPLNIFSAMSISSTRFFTILVHPQKILCDASVPLEYVLHGSTIVSLNDVPLGTRLHSISAD